MVSKNGVIQCGILGYGAMFDFGRAHGQWINATGRMRVGAVWSRSAERREKAAADFPGTKTCATVDELVADPAIDLVAVVTPHHTHRDLVVQALRAGKHVVVDKAMACTVAECSDMVETARRCRKTLAVFHNRRYDGNFRLIEQLVSNGVLGEVFDIACYCGVFTSPGTHWHSEQKASGGIMHLWGPHALDWVLRLLPGKVVGVDAYGLKRIWNEVDILDQQRLILRFDNHATAEVSFSYIDLAPGPLWRIRGTQGAIVDSGDNALRGYYPEYRDELPPSGKLTLTRLMDGRRVTEELPYLPSTWGQYYRDLAAHLLDGVPVPVSAEFGRRGIALMGAANRSCESGHTEVPEYG